MSRRKFYPTEEEIKDIYDRMDKIARDRGYNGLSGFIQAEVPKELITKKVKSDYTLRKSLNYGFLMYFAGHQKINACLSWIYLGKKHSSRTKTTREA